MAKIQQYKIYGFNEPVSPKYNVTVPSNSKFLNKVKVLEDGIYAFYAVYESMGMTRIDRFAVIRPEGDIPVRGDFVDILDVVYQKPFMEGDEEPKQGIMLFPVYKLY